MRGVCLFVAGLLVGVTVHVAVAQRSGAGVEMMNHVGINVPNVADAVKYYTEKMGYREAFRANDAAGAPRLVYMQISRNTFLEPSRRRHSVRPASRITGSSSAMPRRPWPHSRRAG